MRDHDLFFFMMTGVVGVGVVVVVLNLHAHGCHYYYDEYYLRRAPPAKSSFAERERSVLLIDVLFFIVMWNFMRFFLN